MIPRGPRPEVQPTLSSGPPTWRVARRRSTSGVYPGTTTGHQAPPTVKPWNPDSSTLRSESASCSPTTIDTRWSRDSNAPDRPGSDRETAYRPRVLSGSLRDGNRGRHGQPTQSRIDPRTDLSRTKKKPSGAGPPEGGRGKSKPLPRGKPRR